MAGATDRSGIILTIVGTDGVVGSPCGGRWYGGIYVWGFTVSVPGSDSKAHRPFFSHRVAYGFGNALLLTGERRYVETWRGVIQAVNANSRQAPDGVEYPRMFGDDGWYGYRDEPFQDGAEEVLYWSHDATGLPRAARSEWHRFLTGDNPGWPEEALRRDLEEVRRRMAGVRADPSTSDTRLSDDMNHLNPACTEALIRTMLGGLPTGRVGYPLHCQLRYFDLEARRAGLVAGVSSQPLRWSAGGGSGRVRVREDDCHMRRAALNMVRTLQQNSGPDWSIGLLLDKIGRNPALLAPILA